MDEARIAQVMSAPRWSEKKLEEAARGKANGSCEDPPEVELAFWLNIELDRAERVGISIEEVYGAIFARAMNGDFG